VLRRYGYAIYQNRQTSSTLYIETGWQERAPFDDEAGGGMEAARTRFIARGRKTGPSLYALTISVENQVRARSDTVATGWSTMPPTEMYLDYIREITTEIDMKVDAGLRRYDAALAPVDGGPRTPERAAVAVTAGGASWLVGVTPRSRDASFRLHRGSGGARPRPGE
jgi:hypothetical protein